MARRSLCVCRLPPADAGRCANTLCAAREICYSCLQAWAYFNARMVASQAAYEGSNVETKQPVQSFAARPMRDIKESDWKVFKRVREAALERFCGRVLDEIARINSDNTKSKHERYVASYRLVHERDKEINLIFDYLRRSTAVTQLCSFWSHDLMTEQELRQFSPELVKLVEDLHDIYTRPMEVVDEDQELDEKAPPQPDRS